MTTACKAVYAGSIPTSASIAKFEEAPLWRFFFARDPGVQETNPDISKTHEPRGQHVMLNYLALRVAVVYALVYCAEKQFRQCNSVQEASA